MFNEGEKIKSIAREPHKVKTSYGTWAVDIVLIIPIGTGTTTSQRFFYSKKAATKWINDNSNLKEVQ